MKSVLEKVRNILVDQLGVDAEAVTREATLREGLGVDSLDLVEVTMACEEEFGIAVTDEDAEGLVTVGDIVDHVERALARTAV